MSDMISPEVTMTIGPTFCAVIVPGYGRASCSRSLFQEWLLQPRSVMIRRVRDVCEGRDGVSSRRVLVRLPTLALAIVCGDWGAPS